MQSDNFPDCSGQLGQSDSEEDKDAVKTSRKKRLILESEDELSDQPEVKKTPDTSVQTSVQVKQRSSERIRDKLQRKHVRPSREEILNKIEVKNVNYENMSLTRRKVVNEFVKGSSRYVLDSIDVFESDSDDDNDFIDDSKIKGKKYSRARANNKRRRNIRKEFDEYTADDESYSNRKKKLVKKTCKKFSSDDEETFSDKNNASSEVNASIKHSPKQNHRNSKCMRSFPDDEKSCTSEDNDVSDINKSRKHSISNRIESSESEETLQDGNMLTSVDVFEARQSDDEETVSDKNNTSSEVNTSIKHSPKQKHRNSKCLPSFPDDEKSCTSEENDISDINKSRKPSISNRFESSESEETQDENILTSVDVFEARQSDDEFVVDDDEYCEESVNECIHNAKNMLGNNVFRANKKKSSSYQRICIPVQSDDSEADEFAVDSLQPVAYAMLTGHTDCLKLLLHGTSLLELNRMCETNFNFSLLHFVVCGKTTLPNLKCEFTDDFGLFQCLKMLCEHDKEVFMKLSNEKDSQGLTPLVAAIIARHCQCIEYLLQNGASVDDFPKTNGGNLLHFAVENCLTSIVPENAACLNALLYSGLGHKVNQVDDFGFTPLMYAAQAGDRHCVSALLQGGASVTCKDSHGTTSLHLAAASGDTASVKLLLEYGHQVDCLDKCGWPPILYANFAAREDCVLALMQEPNPRQIFVLGDLLQRGTSEAAKEKNFKVVKDVLVALANQDAYYRVFNDFVRRNPNFLDEYDQGLLNQTWRALLDYDNKLGWFKRKLAKLRKGFCVPFPLIINREAVFESAMKKLGSLSGSDLRKCRLEVTFNNEEGICTGPKKEFFVNISKDVVDEQRKLFHLTDDNQYSFVPNAHFAELAKIQGGGPIKNEIDNNLNSSPNVKSSSGTDGEVIIDDEEDRIIAELDISEFDSSLPNSQSKENMKKNPDETKRQEFARHIDEKLIKNILQLKFLGKIIGLSICEGVFINLNLCKPLVKQILGIELSHPDDLGSFDFKLYENLITFVLESDDVAELELPCTLDVINPWNSRPTSLTLFSDERNNEMLSEENKIEFVHCVSEYKLRVLIKRELDAVRDGINEVIPRSLLSLFTADEFSLLINGIGTIDVQDWRTNTEYTPADAENTRDEIKWFWEVVNELKEEEKALLLKFSTGSPCLPAGGFAHLQGLGGRTKFHISMKSERNKIPTASTCFNQLKIPQYDSLKHLRDKLLIAIRHGAEGFSFS